MWTDSLIENRSVDSDGIPLDRAARRTALLALKLLSQGVSSNHGRIGDFAGLLAGIRTPVIRSKGPNHGMRGPVSEASRQHASAVLEILVSTGRMGLDEQDRLSFRPSPSFLAAVGDGRSGMSVAARIRLSKRFEGSDLDRATAFFVGVRTVFGLHRSPDGNHVLVPDGIAVENGAIAAAGALSVALPAEGPQVRRLASGSFAIRTSEIPEKAVVRLDLRRGRPAGGRLCRKGEIELRDRVGLVGVRRPTRVVGPAPSDILSLYPVVSFSGWGRARTRLPKILRDALERTVRPDRGLFEEWMGRRVSDAEWKAVRVPLAKADVGRKATVLQRMLCSMMEPEARKAALRSSKADVALYCWYRGPNRRVGEWRRQASRDWPVFSGMLPKVGREIDAGLPFVDALARTARLSPRRLRELKGMTWNRLTTHGQAGLGDGGLVSRTLACIPDDVPLMPLLGLDAGGRSKGAAKKSVDTDRLRSLVRIDGFVQQLGSAPVPGFDRMILRDPAKVVEACGHGPLADMVFQVSTFGFLQKLSGIPYHRDVDHLLPLPISRILFAAAIGPEGSLKSWRRASENFHRNIGAVSAAFAAEADGIREEEHVVVMDWTPTPGGWSCAEGRIEWLTSHRELLGEGAAMHHCVSSYFSSVRRGGCCIGRVVSIAGERATVEFRPEFRKVRRIVEGQEIDVDAPCGLVPVQLQSFRNSPAPAGCRRVVERFLDAIADGAVEPSWSAFEAMRDNNARIREDRITPEALVARVAPIRAFELARPLLPARLRNLPLHELVSLHDAAAGETGMHPVARPAARPAAVEEFADADMDPAGFEA